MKRFTLSLLATCMLAANAPADTRDPWASPPADAPRDTADAPAAAPASSGLAASNVISVMWHTEMHYEAYPANSMVMREDWYMLLADGTCTSRVPSSLDGFDPAASRAQYPKSWCRWRKKGSWYEVAWNGGKWESLRSMTEFRGGKRGERLERVYSRQKTGGVGGSSTWSGTTLSLHKNGRFELARASHFTSNGSLNPPENEVIVSGSANDDGSVTNVSGKHGGVSTRGAGRGAGETSGTYTFDGFSLELRFDSGRVERRMFGVTSDAKQARFGGDIMFGK